MVKDVLKRFSTLALAALMVLTMLPVMAMAATTTLDVGVDGLSAEADPDVWKFNSGTLEGEVVPTGGCGSTAQTSTLTFVNNKGITAVLAFEYELLITGDGSVTVGGVAISGKGIFSQEFASGEKMDVTITSAESGDDNSTKAIIRNIKLYDPDVNVTVTFAPATTGGSYTVDGNAITSIESKTNTARYDYKLVATANSDDYKFLGWYNNTSKSYFSVDAEVTTNFISDCEITAKFAPKSAAIFDVNGQRFADLGEAVEYAEANNQTLIVLVADGVISGEYTIPSGITLLIPFDDANTLYTNEPGYTTTSSTPSAYRVLSMLSGSSITVDGAISIGGKHYTSSTQYCCYPTGAYGQIIMDSGSTIVLNNGANLYAWGYITGAGIITAKSGANVYEYFQVTDWRGGSYTGNMKDNEQKVFPFSQYYVQNIESELVLYAGANEYAYISVTASIVGTKSATIPFVGEGALFSLDDDGVFVKKYIPSADRMEFKVSGGASLNSIALSVANVSVDSKDYVLPINSNVDIIVESGKTTLAKDVALLPGVTVEVGQDAELIVAEGASVYVYGLTEWNSKYVYTGKNSGFIPVRYSPSGVGSRGLADAMVNINGVLTINGEIYTTASGANICSSLGTGKVIQISSPGAGTITYQNSQADSEYIGIPITPAKLRNADGTYFVTATVEAGTTVNYYKDGGIWHVHTAVAVLAKDATCTEKGNTAGTKCSVCNKILSGVEEIPANGHQWDKGSITTAPTCTEDGVNTFTCLVCDGTKTEKVEKKGHISAEAVKEKVVEPTCTVKGSYDEVVYCKECGKELSRVTKTIDALGHTPGEAKRENVVEPSCMVDGRYEEVVYCSVCNDEISRVNKTIDATGHTPVEVPEVPATCTEPGTTAGTKCDVCGTILSGIKEIPANGHTEVIRNAKPATDTEDGYTGDVYCEVCNELLRNGEVIPATHVKITWIINGVKHETVCAKGEIPVYDVETPAKPETSRFTYEFKGWDKEIVAATENAEYTAEFTAIGKNGLCIEGNDTFWIKNGVNIAFPGLIRIADENGHIHYYYFAEDGKAVKNGNYKVNKNNGLPLPEYGFVFDSDGVIVHDEDTSKNGICDGDGSKFYYIDGVKVGEGLIKVGDYYYYARTSSGEIVRNRQYWITKTNELPIQQGIFDFDAEGRMIVTGFIHAFGATYYYDNGVLAKGFTKIGDDYYIFNASSGKMYSNAMMWVPDNEYGITGGMYEFDADGKMIRTGFITTGGYTYYYDNGVLAKGFTKIGDDYYFFNAGSGKMYRDATLWVADNAEYGFVGGMYYFGADGKMVLPDIENGKKSIVTINGKKYLTIDGAYAPTGLYEIDGNCYYVKAAGELAVGETVWVDNKNGLIPAKGDWRAFDAEGKLIHTGFVTGGDGYVYHYTDDVLSLGFTCIDGEYYLFNAGSGKMYRDANMWVGPNDYGIVGGMYYFDANGKMAR